MAHYFGKNVTNLKIFQLIFAVIFSFVFASCSDDDNSGPNKTEMLSKSWQTESVTVNGIDTTSAFQDFQFIFKEDGNFTQKVSYTTVNNNDTTINLQGSWQFKNDKESLFVIVNNSSGSPDSTNLDILKLESDALWLEENEDDGDTWEWHFIPL